MYTGISRTGTGTGTSPTGMYRLAHDGAGRKVSLAGFIYLCAVLELTVQRSREETMLGQGPTNLVLFAAMAFGLLSVAYCKTVPGTYLIALPLLHA